VFLDTSIARVSRSSVMFDWAPRRGLPYCRSSSRTRRLSRPSGASTRGPRRRATTSRTSSAGFRAALPEWRSLLQVPRYVYLSFADINALLVSTMTPQANELRLRSSISRNGGSAALHEARPAPFTPVAAGPVRPLSHQLVVPLY